MARWTLQPHPRVIGALASPVRQDLVVILENSPPLAAAELARRLGRRPDTLYHHLRALQKAGLVEAETHASTGGRPGSVWRLKTGPLRLSPAALRQNNVSGAERIVGTIARASVRDFRRAIRVAVAGQGPHPVAHRCSVWLTPTERRDLEETLRQLVARLRAREAGGKRAPYVLTSVLAAVAGPEQELSARKGRPRSSAARKA